MDPGLADLLQGALQERFWLPRRGLYRVHEGRALLRTWHHWWQSHALAARLDAYDRTGDDAVREQAYALVEGMRRRGRGRLTNDFYDDLGWLALQLMRMPGREEDVAVLVAAIRTGAAAEGGVVWSTRHSDFRNTPATGPAAIVAMGWGKRTGDSALVEWGLDLVRWLHDTVVTEEGLVHDGQVVRDRAVELDTARYSYNFGLVVGADLAAYELTGDRGYVRHAGLVADAAIGFFADPVTGVWRSEGRGDRALFRAVLAGHLVALSMVTGEQRWARAVRIQAAAIGRIGTGSVGDDWSRPPQRRVDLSEQVAAVLVVEAAFRA